MFYNSNYYYERPYEEIEGEEAICKCIKVKSEINNKHNSCSCSKDGSIIIVTDDCFPDYAGHRINLSLVDKKIKKIIVIMGEYPFDKAVIRNYTLRFSRDMIHWQEEDCGLNECFYFEDIILDKKYNLYEICSFERNANGTWNFIKEAKEYSSFEEILQKYDFNDSLGVSSHQ